MGLEIGDIVMCTVDKIVGTLVFVKIEGGGEGNIILSEIAPGRIRNLRNYVVPKKRLVCKVLRIHEGKINLSLRRVTQKEKKEITEQYKYEKSYQNILKSILKEKTNKIINQILKENSVYNFLEEAKENSNKLEKIVGKSDAEKILKIIKTQKQKNFKIIKELFLTTTKPNGIIIIKEILKKTKEAKIKYISAGHYSIETEAENIKSADKRIQKLISEISEKAKKQNIEFKLKEK